MDDYLRMGAKIVEIWQNMEELILSICLRYKFINVLKDSFDRLVLWYSFEVEFDVLYVWSTVHSYYIRIYTVWEIEFPGFRYNEFFISDVALFLIIVYYRWRPLYILLCIMCITPSSPHIFRRFQVLSVLTFWRHPFASAVRAAGRRQRWLNPLESITFKWI